MRGKIALSLAVVAVSWVIGAAAWVADRPQQAELDAGSISSSLVVEFTSVIGEDQTEGEATAWNNAQKLAVDTRGRLHVVYQSSYRKTLRGGEDRIHYARSPDGRTWTREAEWSGRYPTLAVDDLDRVYIAYVERTAESDRLRLRRRDPDHDEWIDLLVAEAPPRSFAYPALAVGPSALHLAWESHIPEGHTIQYVEIPLDGKFPPEALPSIETVAQSEEGVYFATLTVDARGRIVMAWETAIDARYHRIDGAIRRGTAWQLSPDLSRGAPDARYPALGPAPNGGVRLVYLVREGGRRTSLSVLSYRGRGDPWGRPELLVRKEPDPAEPSYSQLILAFPVAWKAYTFWGYSVPDACGAGPLSWAAWSEPRPLIGAFASYPHVTEGPGGVLHLVWTDRDVDELRAFVVRYARLKRAD